MEYSYMMPPIITNLVGAGVSLTLAPSGGVKLSVDAALTNEVLLQTKEQRELILHWLINADLAEVIQALTGELGTTYEDRRYICQLLQYTNRYQQLQLIAQYRLDWLHAAAIVDIEYQKAGAGIKAANHWLRSR
jgi:hypothetical protein